MGVRVREATGPVLIGARVHILDSTADCPTGEGIVIEYVPSTDEYVVMYHDGDDYTSGMFFPFDLKPIGVL